MGGIALHLTDINSGAAFFCLEKGQSALKAAWVRPSSPCVGSDDNKLCAKVVTPVPKPYISVLFWVTTRINVCSQFSTIQTEAPISNYEQRGINHFASWYDGDPNLGQSPSEIAFRGRQGLKISFNSWFIFTVSQIIEP